MPCWFFLSGLLYKGKEAQKFFFAKVKTQLVPYLMYSVFNALVWGALKACHSEETYMIVKFGGLWFLITLFFISIIYYTIESGILKNVPHWAKTGAMSVFAIAFLLLGFANGGGKIGTHDTITATLVNFIFFHMGYCMESVNTHLSTNNRWWRLVLSICGTIFLISLAYWAPHNPSPVDVNINRFGNRPMFFIHAVLGSTGMLLFSAGIQKNRFIEWLGKNSLMILILHIPLWRITNELCKSASIEGYHCLSLTFVMSLSMSLVLLSLINRYMPFLKGEIKYCKTQ